MPEYPDVTLYVERLNAMLAGQRISEIRLRSPFLLRTVDPPLADFAGRVVTGFERLGKRIVFAFEGDAYLVIHLMVAGRLKWRKVGASVKAKLNLAAFDFPDATVLLTEASKKKRASLHAVQGREQLAEFSRGGLDVFAADAQAFAARLRAENHTLKRALTDPHILDGIGNAYSDEILHRARLSPLTWTSRLTEGELTQLHRCCVEVLEEWTRRLRDEVGDGFPEKVTAFRDEMAVHGRYGQPCPVCGDPVQRIRYADNETSYCATCQTGGRLYADRGISRLLKQDWPRSLEQLEQRRAALRKKVGVDES